MLEQHSFERLPQELFQKIFEFLQNHNHSPGNDHKIKLVNKNFLKNTQKYLQQKSFEISILNRFNHTPTITFYLHPEISQHYLRMDVKFFQKLTKQNTQNIEIIFTKNEKQIVSKTNPVLTIGESITVLGWTWGNTNEKNFWISNLNFVPNGQIGRFKFWFELIEMIGNENSKNILGHYTDFECTPIPISEFIKNIS